MVQGPHMIVFNEQLKLQIFIFYSLCTRQKNSFNAVCCWERLFIPTRPLGKMQLGHIGTNRFSFVLMIKEWATVADQILLDLALAVPNILDLLQSPRGFCQCQCSRMRKL